MMSRINKIPKKYILSVAVIIVVLILGSIFFPASLSYKTAKAEIMPFDIEVSADGEVQASEYERIMIPELLNNQRLRIWHIKITNLVSEGTKVKKGDFIATLDPTEVENRLRRTNEQLEEYTNSLQSALLDSTIVLMEKREDLTNTKDNLEECKITVEQSEFESKATQRQAKIALEKAQLDINTKKRNYEKEIQRQKIKIARIQKRLDSETEMRDLFEKLKKQLHISSPSSGMVVYGKSWRGRKIKVNDDVGPWMPLIATIPDLSSLVSEAIVKEIDIAKIKVDQTVNISIDAFPEDVFKGKIIRIANIGQPIKGAGMNGFKVIVDIDLKGKKILPSMSTSNKILIASFNDDVVVPRSAVFNDDSIQYVFLKDGGSILKSPVKLGGENETHIRITSGLEEGDQVLLTRPDNFKEI